MTIKNKGTFILAVATLLLLWWQARESIWNTHLQIDIWVFWQRLEYWLNNHHSFAGLVGNEILPTTLLYLFLPIALIPVGWLSYATYLPAMLLINLLIISLHWILVENKKIFLTSLLFLGPILLFRFDGLVTLMMLLSFTAFVRNKYPQSGFWLGLATGMKVFPVIFLPYLCLILIKQKLPKELIRWLIAYGEALLVPVMIYFVLGGSLEQIGSALAFHSHKLISIESLSGSLITGWSLIFRGRPPVMLPGNGIWAVEGPAELLNRLWMIPVALVYYFVARRKDLLNRFSWKVPFVLLLIFLIFSKNLNPQYLWWFMALLPMVKPSKLTWILSLACALFNQLVFPVFYTTFTDAFYLHNQSYWVYFLLLARNLGLVVVAYLSVKSLFSRAPNVEGQNE